MAQAASILILLLIIAALFALLMPAALADVDFSPIMQIIHRPHAVKKHGGDAILIRHACDNGGRMHVYQSQSWRTPDKFFEVCHLDDGRVGIRIREWSRRLCDWIERTSFIPGDGSYRHVIEYVSAKADEVAPRTLRDYSCD